MFDGLSRKAYIIIISLILGVAFLSQQTYAREYGSKIYLAAATFFKKANGEVAGGEGPVKAKLEKTNFFENSFLKK